MLYSADSGVRRKTPALGRFTPLCGDGSSRARTLKSRLRLLNGSSANNASISRDDVLAKLRQLLRRVAFADQQQIDLLGRRTVLEDVPDRSGMSRRAPRALTKREAGSTSVDQMLREAIVGLPLLERHANRLRRPREPQRLVKAPMRGPDFGGGLPLAVNRRKPAGVEDAVARFVAHLEQVLAEVGRVDELRAASGPRAVVDDPIERHSVSPRRDAARRCGRSPRASSCSKSNGAGQRRGL